MVIPRLCSTHAAGRGQETLAAGSILVPSSDWCLCSKCPSTISTHNLSVSIRPPAYLRVTSSTIHPSFHPFVPKRLAISFFLSPHWFGPRLRLKAFSTFALLFSGRWKSSVCGGGRWKVEGLFMRHWQPWKTARFQRPRQQPPGGNESNFGWKGNQF